MNYEIFKDLVSTVAFPIAVTTLLLYKDMTTTKELTDKLQDFTATLKTLVQIMSGKVEK